MIINNVQIVGEISLYNDISDSYIFNYKENPNSLHKQQNILTHFLVST